ncbi:translocation/assembly module TamB domain-containing protein [Acetobacteraceae bacterium B3987]|nr:translocation/assembly module TamB domain-containing protein [Acetobacteraceae bacterium B3987]
MLTLRRRLLRYGLIFLAVLVLLVALLLVGINLPQTKRFVEQKLPEWSGGMVQVEGMRGILPWHLALSHVVLRDPQGIWLEGRDADLRLGLLALLHKQVHVRHLSAGLLAYDRNPAFPPSSKPQETSSTGLPSWGVRVDRLELSLLTVGQTVFGQAARLKIEGKAHLASLSNLTHVPSFKAMPAARLWVKAERLDNPAHLLIDLNIQRHRGKLQLHYDEEAHGFAASPGGLTVLDPLSVDLSLDGPYKALAIKLDAQAATHQESPLTIMVKGSLDCVHLKDDLTLAVHAPPMTLRPDVGWEKLDMTAALHGAMLDPQGTMQLDGVNLMAAGAGAGHVHVQFDGQAGGVQALLARDAVAFGKARAGRDGAGKLSLSARLDGVRIPGKAPTILADAPLVLDATIQPYQPDRPYQIRLEHDAIRLAVAGNVASTLAGHMQLDVEKLPDLAALIGQKVAGSAHVDGNFSVPLQAQGDMTAALEGRFGLKEGPAQAVALIGDQGTLHVQAKRDGTGLFQLEQASLGGRTFRLEGKGQLDPKQVLSASLTLALSDLEALHTALRGKATLEASVRGPMTDLAMQAHLGGMLGVVHPSVSLPVAPLDLRLDVAHLPSQPQGTVQMSGMLDRSPLKLHMTFARNVDGGMAAAIDALEWKELQGKANVALPAGRRIPRGDVELRISRLDGFSRLLGRPMAGHLQLAMHTLPGTQTASMLADQPDRLTLALDGQFHMGGYAVNMLKLKGEIQHLQQDPAADLALQLSGLRANAITGDLKLRVKGPQTALGVQADGAFEHVMEAPARFALLAQANLPAQSVKLEKLSAGVKGDTLRLLSPVTMTYGPTLAVEKLSLELRPPHGEAGRVVLNGTLKPDLMLDARLEHITPALAEPFVPSLHAKGEFNASAKLKGSMTAPMGRITLDGTNLGLMSEPTAALPAGRLHVQVELNGKQAQLRTELRAGEPMAFLVTGKVPLSPTGTLDLSAKGRLMLSVANAFLGTAGMGVGGQLSLDLGIKGPMQQPMVNGTVQLHNGVFDHYAQGVHLQAIDAVLMARGDNLVLDHVTARAGRGTLGMTGQVGILRPGLPVDLQFLMDKAQPIQSDMLTEEINSHLHIHGQATTRIDVEGDITVPEASITLPDSMPASVPQLEVITLEEAKKVPRPEPKLVVGLNIDFTSPGRLFVRGHGLFAEMQGKLHIGGISTAPLLTGGINLKRGNFNLAGINLNFTYGQVGFNGGGVAHRLDPTIDFRADRNANGTLASLLVRGYASDPKIDFVSNPSRPRDEVLSILLFGTDRNSLSSTQLASLGLAIVQIGGGSAFDPMGKVRSTLGLDHLAIGGGNSVGQGAASVEAGKYVMKGVYVGAKEGLSGKGAQAQVKVDLTKRLQLNTTVGTGGQVTGFTTPENDPGSSVGLSYGIDY